MIYPVLSAEEAAEFVKNGMNIGVSGFTIPGNPKKVPPAIAAKARREHEAGREFKINLFSGASTNDYTDGELSRAHAINFRAPYQSSPELRPRINAGELHYNDRHLSEMAQEFRYNYYGKMDIAIIEAQSITDDGEIVLGTAVGNSPTWLKVADKVIVELNDQLPESIRGLHDARSPSTALTTAPASPRPTSTPRRCWAWSTLRSRWARTSRSRRWTKPRASSATTCVSSSSTR